MSACVKCQPHLRAKKFILCEMHFRGWPKGKYINEYMERSCMPDEPKLRRIPYNYKPL